MSANEELAFSETIQPRERVWRDAHRKKNTLRHLCRRKRFARQASETSSTLPFFFSFFFRRSRQLAVELLVDLLCGVEGLCSAQGGMVGSCSVHGKAPMGQLHSNPIAVSRSGHTGKQINQFIRRSRPCVQKSPPHKRFLVGCSSPFMRLAEHLTVLRAWCQRYLPGR